MVYDIKHQKKMNLTRYSGIKKIYFDRILKTIIKIGYVKDCDGLILDYGSGNSRLRNFLKNHCVCEYDKFFNDGFEFKNYRPEIIIMNHVLEHMTPQEIHELMNDFYDMNREAVIITGIPLENKLSKTLSVMLGRPSHIGHITPYKVIDKTLRQHLVCIKTKRVFGMTEVSLWLLAD